MSISVIIIIAIVVLAVLWVTSVQRKLVAKDELCQNSMSQIGVQQQSRWDAITALVDLVRSYNEHEYNTLKDVISMRRQINGASSPAEADAQETAITGALKQINVVAEQYPELKANENYAKLMDNVNQYENQVRVSRMVYNDTVTKFNSCVRQFPDSIVAGFLHFPARQYLQEVASKSDMPSTKI